MNKDPNNTEKDIEIIGPGALLAQARVKNKLSVNDVATRLNFRVNLVQDIEHDVFDSSLPATYNRGYLKNYAKLVGLSADKVIASYEKLNQHQDDLAQMKSFSRGTSKQTQNNILMWITYFILAIFIGLTTMWWLQGDKISVVSKGEEGTEIVIKEAQTAELSKDLQDNTAPKTKEEPIASSAEDDKLKTSSTILDTELAAQVLPTIEADTEVPVESMELPTTVTTIFTFSGDCWVNINDATGERIAWGIKKSGYIMTIKGKPPLKITIGKPELVDINFNGENIDMSTFRQGYIAKFTLPLSPEPLI